MIKQTPHLGRRGGRASPELLPEPTDRRISSADGCIVNVCVSPRIRLTFRRSTIWTPVFPASNSYQTRRARSYSINSMLSYHSLNGRCVLRVQIAERAKVSDATAAIV